MKAISLCQRERIFTLLQEGYSSREVAFREKVSHVSVLRIKKKKEKTGHFDVVPRPGRPRILTERHDRNIAKLIKTVRRSLRKQGLVSRVKKRKPLLLKRHRIARKKFAQKYRNWTIEDWHKVVWSDESKFMIFGSDGREWCWRDPNLPLKSQHVKPTVKFGGGSIMIWGCMGAFGVGKYCKIDGRMDGELYREILEEEFLGTLSECDLSVDDVIFQQDNDPKHTANKTYEWFKDNDVEILDWPAQSPDLNPIEHLWNEIDRRLRQLPGNITSKDDLWDKVQLVWNQIDVDFCLKLIDTMPQRIKDVLRAGGGYTEW
ncbi:unnamed protein product [Rhizophagus irregularis]|nr:unnamed protein product [Rhizophagus irregularis]